MGKTLSHLDPSSQPAFSYADNAFSPKRDYLQHCIDLGKGPAHTSSKLSIVFGEVGTTDMLDFAVDVPAWLSLTSGALFFADVCAGLLVVILVSCLIWPGAATGQAAHKRTPGAH